MIHNIAAIIGSLFISLFLTYVIKLVRTNVSYGKWMDYEGIPVLLIIWAFSAALLWR